MKSVNSLLRCGPYVVDKGWAVVVDDRHCSVFHVLKAPLLFRGTFATSDSHLRKEILRHPEAVWPFEVRTALRSSGRTERSYNDPRGLNSYR